MGRPKLALPVRGEPMLRQTVRAALASQCREVIVVLGTHADAYRPMLPARRRRDGSAVSCGPIATCVHGASFYLRRPSLPLKIQIA